MLVLGIYKSSNDDELETNAPVLDDLTADVNSDPDPMGFKCIDHAFKRELGVREVGRNGGKRVTEYLNYTGLGSGYAWCGSFACFNLGSCGVPNPMSAWSPTVAYWNVVYKKGDKFPTKPNGLIFGLYYKRLGRVGHVGYIEEIMTNNIKTIEGNTSSGGSRDGDGVYRRMRPKWAIEVVSQYGKGIKDFGR